MWTLGRIDENIVSSNEVAVQVTWTRLGQVDDYFFRWMSLRVAFTHRRPAVPPHKAQAIAAFELLFIRALASLGLSP